MLDVLERAGLEVVDADRRGGPARAGNRRDASRGTRRRRSRPKSASARIVLGSSECPVVPLRTFFNQHSATATARVFRRPRALPPRTIPPAGAGPRPAESEVTAWRPEQVSRCRTTTHGRSRRGSGTGRGSAATRSALEICGVAAHLRRARRASPTAPPQASPRSGSQPGEHVSLMMQNSIENVEAWFGLQKAGLVEVPIHTASRGAALRYIVDHADARALVIDEAFLPHLAAIADELPQLRHVIVNRDEPATGRSSCRPGSRSHDLADLYASGRPHAERRRCSAQRHRRRPALVGHDRAAEGRRALARGRAPPDAPPGLADGLHARRPPLHGVPALPQQRQVHERLRGARVRRLARDGQALPGVDVLGDRRARRRSPRSTTWARC